MKIYTKTGDQGKTRLVDGRECSKASLRVETYGAVDELNSFLGLALSTMKDHSPLKDLSLEIKQIQNQLFTLGSHLACEAETARQHLPSMNAAWVEDLEKSIDQMTSQLAPLKNFILPGGDLSSGHLHISRTVARRAERMVVRLLEEIEAEKPSEQKEIHLALIYLNRLSDYLFTAARFANHKLGQTDQIWEKP